MPQVVVILGSRSDLGSLEKAQFCEVLKQVGVSYEVSIISAHRNPEELGQYCNRKRAGGALVFVGVAGMAAALPGAIAALVPDLPVIGVPLPSEGYPDAMDALLAMYRMPPGRPVAVCSFVNAAVLACQMVALGDRTTIRSNLSVYLAGHVKPPEFGVMLS